MTVLKRHETRISVTTPSGTAISTNIFTVLNNGGSVYFGVLIGWNIRGGSFTGTARRRKGERWVESRNRTAYIGN